MKKRDKIFKKSSFHFIVQFNPRVLYTVMTAGLHHITMHNDQVKRWDDYCFSTFVMTHSSCWPWWSSRPEPRCVFSCRGDMWSTHDMVELFECEVVFWPKPTCEPKWAIWPLLHVALSPHPSAPGKPPQPILKHDSKHCGEVPVHFCLDMREQ